MLNSLSHHRNSRMFANKEILEIFAYEVLKELAFGLVGIFVAVYLYVKGVPVYDIVLLYAFESAIHGLTAFFLARGSLTKIGIKHTFIIATILFIGSFIAIEQGILFQWILLWAIGNGMANGLYASAHHSYLTLTVDRKVAGSEVATMSILVMLVDVLTPFIGAVMISLFGFKHMLLVGSGFLVASLVPLFLSPEISTTGQVILSGISHIKSFWHEKKTIAWSAIGNGFDGSSNPMWDSLYIFKLVKGIRALGALTSGLSFVQIVTQYIGGKRFDDGNSTFDNGVSGSIFSRFLIFASFYPIIAIASQTLNSAVSPFYTAPYNGAFYKELLGPHTISHVVAHENLWHVANVFALLVIALSAYLFGWYAFLVTGIFMIIGKLIVRQQRVGGNMITKTQ